MMNSTRMLLLFCLFLLRRSPGRLKPSPELAAFASGYTIVFVVVVVVSMYAVVYRYTRGIIMEKLFRPLATRVDRNGHM